MVSHETSPNGNPMNDALTSLVYKITILVVDDDSTSLAIVSAMLRKFHYEVTSVKTPMAALSVLQTNGCNIDLVVTDLHMPEMNGIELQRRITRQYKLPVVIMSSDDSESAMVESLAGGAVFFIVKPVNPDGLKNVWQYAVSAKKGKAVVIDLDGQEEGDSSPSAGKLSLENMRSPPPVNDNRDKKNEGKRGTKRKSPSKGKDDKYEENKKHSPKMYKRPKVVWTNDLHNLFMDALKDIGFEKAVPKKILEHMNVTTLTRENVASHLQKYRMFLKRIAEKGCFTSKAIIDRFLKSTFAAGHPLLLKTAQEYSRMHDMERLRALTSYPGFGSSLLNSTRYASLGYSSSDSPPPQPYGAYGSGQSRLLSNQTSRPVLVNNQPYLDANNRRLGGFGNGSNLSPLNGGFSTGLINGANSSYPQQIQPRPDFYNAGPGSSSSSQFGFRSPVRHSSGSTLGNGIFVNTSSSYPSLNPGYTGNTNSYPDRQLLGMGQATRHNSCSMNGTNFNGNTNVAATMGNQSFPYMTSGGYSNQVSPALTASNQQASISSVLASLGGNSVPNDYNSDHLVENAPSLDNLNNEQLGGGGGDGLLSDLILESNKLSNKQKKKQQHQEQQQQQQHQQQQQQQQQQQAGSDGGENPEFSLRSLFPEIYPSLEELLNLDESESSDDTGPFSEEDVGQVQSALEQLINPNNTAAADANANASNETDPTELIQNTNQQKSEGGGQLAEPELISNVIEVNDAPAPAEDDSSDKDPVDEDLFLDSLFSCGYPLE